MSRTTSSVAASAIAAAALIVTSSATAAPVGAEKPADREPTQAAKEAGITQTGDAAMGWKERGPHRRTATSDASATSAAADGVPGIDVSNWQGEVDWPGQWDAGKRFAYVKATEGTGYKSPAFSHQYTGSYDVGMFRGAYHFALPDSSSGAAQANYFVDNGGGWSSDGKTLPGVLDIEWNPYGSTCYGKSQADMRAWITDFTSTYQERTGRYPAIYTNTNWWNECVGDDTSFAEQSPLWIARYADSVGTLPAGWQSHTFWQYTDNPIDQNVFNGTMERLEVFASE